MDEMDKKLWAKDIGMWDLLKAKGIGMTSDGGQSVATETADGKFSALYPTRPKALV